ncbi:MAG TPA: hypothetical protein VG456_04555 [Candidatus Sulfopaludibacter sp.]|nr:hypothetical protein [Candidatus Sulfopaludibacter sp.]
MGKLSLLALLCLVQAARPQETQTRGPLRFHGEAHAGAAVTSPNLGEEGTLDVLEGGGSSRVWSFDVAANAWSPAGIAPQAVGPGGALSSLFNACDYALVGGGSRSFFSTGTGCDLPSRLADAPAAAGDGAAMATAPGLQGSPVDSVFALRGGGTSDFWRYSISQNTWTPMPATPAPVGSGSAMVEAASCGVINSGSLFQVAAIRGGGTSDFWCFDITGNTWLTAGIPALPSPVGPGGSLAQLQRLGQIFVLRGGGSSDFWTLRAGAWVQLAATPGPVDEGGSLVGINYGTASHRDELFALQGGGSGAVWKYDVSSNVWTQVSEIPVSRPRDVR